MKLDPLLVRAVRQRNVEHKLREAFFNPPKPLEDPKNRAMQALGRLGGRPKKALSLQPAKSKKALKITNVDNKNRLELHQTVFESASAQGEIQ